MVFMIVISGVFSAAAPPPPPPPPPPPVIRPKKPPRLLQYAQQTLNRHSINVALNTPIKTSHEKSTSSPHGDVGPPQDTTSNSFRNTTIGKLY